MLLLLGKKRDTVEITSMHQVKAGIQEKWLSGRIMKASNGTVTTW